MVLPAMWMGSARQPSLALDALENNMSNGAPSYPICEFLNRLVEEFGPSRSDFVQALGYRNLERGMRRLVPWLEYGNGFYLILTQIKKRYPGQAEELERAVLATRAMKSAEAQAAFLERCKTEADTFRPYIHADGETRVPSGIMMFGMTGGHSRWTTIEIPRDISKLPIKDQLAALPKLMLAYKLLYKGACPFFGKLTGFKFVRLVEYLQFDEYGKLMKRVDQPFRTGYVEVTLR